MIQKKLGLAPLQPLRSHQEAIDYIEKQAAFVSQVTLYGYIKTRAGTQFPKLFENENYLTSMKMARWHIFGASVADLAIYMGARLVVDGGATPAQAEAFAARAITAILKDYQQDDIDPAAFDEMIERGQARCAVADWPQMAEEAFAFQSSADALIRWAPIADELKSQDEEIVRNSIHMKWINIRRETRQIMQPPLIIGSME
ncbi:MAG: hypothetical protein ACON4P_06770 [Candidatus Puniceispirillales bacterium]